MRFHLMNGNTVVFSHDDIDRIQARAGELMQQRLARGMVPHGYQIAEVVMLAERPAVQLPPMVWAVAPYLNQPEAPNA